MCLYGKYVNNVRQFTTYKQKNMLNLSLYEMTPVNLSEPTKESTQCILTSSIFYVIDLSTQMKV